VSEDTRTFRSELRAPPQEVWEHATSLEGINRELWPLRMTAPPGLRSIADSGEAFPSGVPIGEPLFVSWVLLGVLPIERMRLRLAALDVDARSFVESSDVFSMRLWRHERRVDARDGTSGSVLTDRLTFAPRMRLFAPVARAFVGRVFTRRHAVLRRLFG
jgi:ligand-binding SRPBCC domain-containing protein